MISSLISRLLASSLVVIDDMKNEIIAVLGFLKMKIPPTPFRSLQKFRRLLRPQYDSEKDVLEKKEWQSHGSCL